LEVVRTLNDHGIETEAPVEVAFWTTVKATGAVIDAVIPDSKSDKK
jgi:hypothetical protein